MNQSHPIWRAVNVLIAVAAYGYLLYLLITYPHYDALWASFAATDATRWLLLLLTAVLLMPLNLLLEALKWRFLLRRLASMTVMQALAQVLHGLQGALLTPARLGEYPTRVLSIADQSVWPKAIAQGMVGSAALTAVNILCGLLALLLYSCDNLMQPWMVWAAIGIAAAMLMVVALVQKGGSLMVMLLCLLRYLVFSLQFASVLIALGIGLDHSVWMLIPIYYMLVTIIPALPIADPAIKGSVGAMVFASASIDPALVALATMLLWVINTIIPMLCNIFLQKRH